MNANGNVSAGRDIIGSNITQIVGSNPSISILESTAEQLAEAENDSRKIIRKTRSKRIKGGAISFAITFGFLVLTAVLGYFWLFRSGEVKATDIVKDLIPNFILPLVISLLTLLPGAIFGGKMWRQFTSPSDAENINKNRLRLIQVRWDELNALGLSKKRINMLRRKK